MNCSWGREFEDGREAQAQLCQGGEAIGRLHNSLLWRVSGDWRETGCYWERKREGRVGGEGEQEGELELELELEHEEGVGGGGGGARALVPCEPGQRDAPTPF